jgi:hypothetical protein
MRCLGARETMNQGLVSINAEPAATAANQQLSRRIKNEAPSNCTTTVFPFSTARDRFDNGGDRFVVMSIRPFLSVLGSKKRTGGLRTWSIGRGGRCWSRLLAAFAIV